MSDQDRADPPPPEEVQALRARLAELERAEQERAGEAGLYRLLFERNPHPVWVFNRETFGFLALNEAMTRDYGYTREELLAGTPELIHPPEEWARFCRYWKQADCPDGAEGPCPHGEWKHRRKDGTVFDVELLASHLNYRGAEGCLVLTRDVTAQKETLAALRDSEERHRLLAELTSDYTYACRVEADGRVVIESATGGMIGVTGYSPEEAEARGGWTTLIHPDDLEEARRASERAVAGERTWVELRLRTREGETRWVRVTTQPIRAEDGGRVVRMLGAVQDITERKRAEEQLQEYARRLRDLSRRLLEVQEAERRYLALELHDEVGQILTGLQLGLETSAQALPEELRPGLADARALIRDLTGRVRDLSLRLRPTMLDDLGLLPALLWHFERYTAQTRVQVAFEHHGLEGRFAPEVETAAYRIVQEALTNIARHGGADRATVRVWVEGDVLCLQVENPHNGFDPEAGRAAAPSTGLSGMQERASLLGGRLFVESLPGSGTRLTAELPVQGTSREQTMQIP